MLVAALLEESQLCRLNKKMWLPGPPRTLPWELTASTMLLSLATTKASPLSFEATLPWRLLPGPHPSSFKGLDWGLAAESSLAASPCPVPAWLTHPHFHPATVQS